MKILIVDDNPDVGVLVCKLANMCGHETRWETTGEASIAAVADWSPDLVLMDIMLGAGIDGLEAVRRIREAGYPGSVVMFSALSEIDIKSFARTRGADDYVVKGRLDTHALTRLVSDATNRKRTAVISPGTPPAV